MPGLYAWLATVLLPVAQHGVAWLARGFGLLSLSALVAAFWLGARHARLARLLGVHGFLLSCFGAWACLGPQLRSDQLDPVRGALGAVGFLLHALAWGAAPKPIDEEAGDNLVPGLPLLPRQRPFRAAPFALAAGVVLALAPSALAFGVERPGASLLAHALALASGVLVIAASTDVALRLGQRHQPPAWRPRAARAVWPLGGLTVALGIGLIWLALH